MRAGGSGYRRSVTPLAPGQISLRIYPHRLPPVEQVEQMRAQARTAECAGWDGLMTSEHHGGFPDYVPNPLQLAGWLLEATERVWAAPCPLLLPLYADSHVAEQVAWLAARFPERVGLGVAVGGLAQDFEMAGLDFAERGERFAEALPRLAAALRGEAEGPLSQDPAVAATRAAPVPVVSAAQGPKAVARAAAAKVGVLFDSMQTPTRMRELSDAYVDAGGKGARIAIRRVWIGAPPSAEVAEQMEFYRSYAPSGAQDHWGDGQQMIAAERADDVAEGLIRVARDGGCDAFNLRLHVKGVEAARVDDQIARVGEELLPLLRRAL